MAAFMFSIFLFLICNILPFQTLETDKRLLLTDPDVVAARLAKLEAEVLSLKTENVAQEKEVLSLKTLEAEVLSLKAENVAQEKEVVSLKTQNLAQEKAISQLMQSSNSDHGSTFIRWGRRNCPKNTEIIYSGYTAGQENVYSGNRYGGPSNTLCLPSDPELSNQKAVGSSRIYGTEFEEDYFGTGAHNEDVPCALCRSNSTSASVMIPGRRSCYSGWKKEYDGIIGSGGYGQKASSYICVDSHPEYIPGGERNSDGHLLYATTLNCGSLSCPPYHSGFQLLCVVCSK